MREVDEAADRVSRAMRALDAHRHGSAPTLEREYRRALEAYFVASQESRGVVGQADEEALDDDDLVEEDVLARAGEIQRARDAILGHYAAARDAVRLWRAYRRESVTTGRRERECLEAIQRHRASIRALRLRARPSAEQLVLPGLAKTRPAGVVDIRRAKTG